MTDGKQAADPAGHAPLIVWCADAQAGKPILKALQRGFDLDARAALPDPGASADSPDMLLLCLSPIEVLCRAMAEGVVPSTALKGWQEQAQAMVRLNRRDRRRVRVLDIRMATAYPKAFLRWFALPEDKAMIAALSRSGQPERNEILHLLALHTLLGDTPARALMEELDAVSLNFAKGDDRVAGNPDAAFLSYQENPQAREQVALLEARNRAALDDMEMLSKRKIQLELELEKVGVIQAQNQLMLHELEVLEQAGAAKQQQIEALEQTLEQFMTSRSYRLTAPLRGLRALLSGRKPV